MIWLIISCVLAIASIVIYIYSVKFYKQTKQRQLDSWRNELYKDVEDLRKNKEEVINQYYNIISTLENEIKADQKRAQEAREAYNLILSSESDRIQAQLDKLRASKLGEIETEAWCKKINEDNAFKEIQEQNQISLNQWKIEKEKIQFVILKKYNREIEEIKQELEDYRKRRIAINEAVLREKEIEEHEMFYSIEVSEQDREDIYTLQNMDLKLHNRDVIPKLIWELYLRRPVQEMIKRIVGNQKISGIYKITYKKTGEAYIGKTTDFSTRWQNHVKTSIGLEGAARATLHNRLAKDGIWNYTFEILEEVPKENLSEREAYYIKLYGTKDQLNMKEGNNNGTE